MIIFSLELIADFEEEIHLRCARVHKPFQNLLKLT